MGGGLGGGGRLGGICPTADVNPGFAVEEQILRGNRRQNACGSRSAGLFHGRRQEDENTQAD